MAFPDYSLLLVEVLDPLTSVVTRNTYIFTDVKNAQIAYKAEVSQSNRRVFLFEQPQPTKFHRDDSVPVPTSLDQWD